MTSSTHPARHINGVNLVGFLTAEFGLGTAVRNAHSALRAAGIPCSLRNFMHCPARTADTELLALCSDAQPYDVNLVFINPDVQSFFVQEVGEAFFRNHINIGAWVWELQRMPRAWRASFALYDEIWTCSAYVRDILRRISPVPVRHAPHAVVLRKRKRIQRREIGVPEHHTLFLTMFDFCSVFERKNPIGVIHAFLKAFSASENATLVIKSINGRSFPEKYAELRAYATHSHIRLIDEYWSPETTHGLIASCDAYVSLHRAEGFGLTIAEAMALGKPVIATGYSGNMDFMTEENSFPVSYALTRLTQDRGPYERGDMWAEPAIDHAAAHMRRVHERHPDCRMRAARAASDMHAHFSPQVIGGKMASLISALVDVGTMEPHARAVTRSLPTLKNG